jgi:hypothetical protein
MTFPGVDPFCIPALACVKVAGAHEAHEVAAQPLRGRSLEPETPPPRA